MAYHDERPILSGQSNRAESSPAADSVAPPPSSSNLDSDITDELTDHLSLAARDLQLAGHTPEEAHQLAHRKFGDVATIRRRLWWIHQGDELMLRTALAIVCTVLILAVAALGIGNWRMSRTIDDLHATLGTMSENQKALTDAQKSILETQRLNRPLTIQGHLYVGDPSTPAPGAAVHLYRVSDRKLIEKYTSDARGQFVTAPLAPDRYFIIAPLVGFNFSRVWAGAAREKPDAVPDGARSLFGAQSAPIEVSIDGKQPQIDLDVQPIPVGQVSFDPPRGSVSIHLPDRELRLGRQLSDEQIKWLKYTFELASSLRDKGISFPIQLHSVLRVVMVKQGPDVPDLIPSRISNDEQWSVGRGIYGGGLEKTQAWAGHWSSDQPLFFGRLGRGFDLCETGKYRFAAYLTLQEFNPGGSELGASRSEDRERVALERMQSLPPGNVQHIEVQEGRRTHLRLIAPADFDKEVLAAMENVSNQADFDALFDRVWPVQVEQFGYEEMILKDVER
jgi:hypothetical protein